MEQLIEKIDQAASYILRMLNGRTPEIAMVLGSGLGDLADELENPVAIPYRDIPGFPVSTVKGHKGRLVAGTLEGREVICMQGRFHYYEGYEMDLVVFPIQVMRRLGIENLLLTNAAGCVNEAWKPGDLMVITDHIKLVAENPLRGVNCEELGPRFFDMSNAYDSTLAEYALECGKKLGMNLRQGVYQLFCGPSFETKAEVRFARICGADAVGMSTVPEAIAASHMGMHTMGISCMTNMAAGILDQPLNHKEVLETGQMVKSSFTALVRSIVKDWPL